MSNTAFHGIRVQETDSGTRYLDIADSSVVGIVCTGDDADDTKFPLDTPVLLTGVRDAASYAGDTGTLATSLEGIASQTEPYVVVVRVAEGETEAETTSNIIGGSQQGRYTGMQALKSAPAQLSVKPRILGVPGLDTQPVTTAMATIAASLRGMVYASCDGAADITACATYRKNFAARELMLIWPDFVAWDSDSDSYKTANAISRALGLRAKIDQQVGWHKSLSNVAVSGVTGMSHDVYWDLQSSTTDAAYLNQNEITTLIQRDGYRFWGNRTCSDDSRFAFEVAVRTNAILADTIANGLFWAVDKPLSVGLVRDIIDTINAAFKDLKSQGKIIGASAWIDPTKNTSTTLAAGKLRISYDFTPCPPVEDLTFISTITGDYLADFATLVTGSAA